ncbi:MAG: hypothetical protein ACRC8M_08615 [Cetobacterium sp.]|uniref:hypothetical protein n=1 Tax=Cetobacterium sp. TaxID=2071632 RepID=UPI003F3014CA
MRKRIILLMILLTKVSYPKMDSNIKSIPKEISVDIIAEVNKFITIVGENGSDLRKLEFYHGSWDAVNLGRVSEKHQEFFVKGAPERGKIKFQIDGEKRSKAYLVHEKFNNIDLNGNEGSWNRPPNEKYNGVILPHQYHLNIESGAKVNTGSSELSYEANYSNSGGISVSSAEFEITNSEVELKMTSALSGHDTVIERYPGRYFNSSTLTITITQQ